MKYTIEIIQEVFNTTFENCPKITIDTSKEDIPDWDSLTNLSLVLNLEEQLNLQFTIEEIESIKDVKSIIQIVNRK